MSLGFSGYPGKVAGAEVGRADEPRDEENLAATGVVVVTERETGLDASISRMLLITRHATTKIPMARQP
jgi:hypothetical protein